MSIEFPRRMCSGLLLATVGLAVVLGGLRGPGLRADEPAADAKKPAPVGDVSSIARELVADGEIPALALAVVRSDRIVATGVAGVRKRGDETLARLDDPFHIGSCTKAMTATLCALLIEQGKLDWTTTIGEGLPGVEIDPGFRDVTLEALLSNHGRCSTAIPGPIWGALWVQRADPVAARRALTRSLLSTPPQLEKDVYEYSNTGFAIAGHIAETKVGESYESLMRKMIFEPLGMESADFGAPGTPGEVDAPWGHRHDGTPVEPGPNADNPPAITPAGTVHATITDWAKFVQFHLRGARGEESRLRSFAKLHARYRDDGSNYAMGWVRLERPWAKAQGAKDGAAGGAEAEDRAIDDAKQKDPLATWRGGDVLTHNGSNNSWFAVTWIAPARDFAVVVACNRGGPLAARATDQAAARSIRWFEEHERATSKKKPDVGK